jgi:maltooligosyltrehalose trehalohydrolase
MEALLAVLLLAPQIPLLFMGEEWGETRSFGFFTDFHGELGRIVREGRRREFAKWPHFASDEHSENIADPNVERTFLHSRLDWAKLESESHRKRFAYVAGLLELRRREIVPLIPLIGANAGRHELLADRAFVCTWKTSDLRSLSLAANFGDEPVAVPATLGRVIFASPGSHGELSPASVVAAVSGEAGGGPA